VKCTRIVGGGTLRPRLHSAVTFSTPRPPSWFQREKKRERKKPLGNSWEEEGEGKGLATMNMSDSNAECWKIH